MLFWKHRIIQVVCWKERPTSVKLLTAMTNWVLNICKDRDSTSSMGNLLKHLITLMIFTLVTLKIYFIFQTSTWNSPCSSLSPFLPPILPLCPSETCLALPGNKSGSNMTSAEPSLHWTDAVLSLVCQVFLPRTISVTFCWTHSGLALGSPNLDTVL